MVGRYKFFSIAVFPKRIYATNTFSNYKNPNFKFFQNWDRGQIQTFRLVSESLDNTLFEI